MYNTIHLDMEIQGVQVGGTICKEKYVKVKYKTCKYGDTGQPHEKICTYDTIVLDYFDQSWGVGWGCVHQTAIKTSQNFVKTVRGGAYFRVSLQF